MNLTSPIKQNPEDVGTIILVISSDVEQGEISEIIFVQDENNHVAHASKTMGYKSTGSEIQMIKWHAVYSAV